MWRVKLRHFENTSLIYIKWSIFVLLEQNMYWTVWINGCEIHSVIDEIQQSADDAVLHTLFWKGQIKSLWKKKGNKSLLSHFSYLFWNNNFFIIAFTEAYYYRIYRSTYWKDWCSVAFLFLCSNEIQTSEDDVNRTSLFSITPPRCCQLSDTCLL